MGSYLSIENNTSDAYLVKVGPDEAALKIAGIVTAVVAAVSTVISAGAALAPLAAVLAANGVVEVLGVSTAAIAAITSFASSISGVTIAASVVGWAQSMVLFITKTLIYEHGYVEIKPGQTHVFGEYTLSLWRQATCVRVRHNPSNKGQVVMDTVYMRPIFSAATADSTQPHNIAYWISKFGHADRLVVQATGSPVRANRAASDVQLQPPPTISCSWPTVLQDVALKRKQAQLLELNSAVSEEEEHEFLAAATTAAASA